MSKLDLAVEDIKKLKAGAKKVAENSEDVKSGKCTVEDEMAEPAFRLYDQIANANIEILQNPEMVKAFNNIAECTSDELASNLAVVVAVAMTQASHQAILFYDELLKHEIDTALDYVYEGLNNMAADNEGLHKAFTAMKNKIDELTKESSEGA